MPLYVGFFAACSIILGNEAMPLQIAISWRKSRMAIVLVSRRLALAKRDGGSIMRAGFPRVSLMRAILASLFLCTALSAGQAAEPSQEMIARGKALVDAGDCYSCHTSDPAKPFAGGVRIETPFCAITSPNL